MESQFTETERTCLEIVSAFKPKIFKDGNKWCCLYGENLQEGIAAFGETPMNAIYEFYNVLFKP